MRSRAAKTLGALLLSPCLAWAALSDEIQVYDDDINAPGESGLEMHVNTTPKGRKTPAYPGEAVPEHGLRLTPEFSYGLSRNWEAGLYVPFNFDASGKADLAGLKLRLKWLPIHGEAGWFAGANGELSRLKRRFSESRNAFELRTIAGYRTEQWLFSVNPVFGWDLSPGFRSGNPDFALGLKAARKVSGKLAVGAEYYADMGRLDHLLPAREQERTLFGVVDVEMAGWSLGFGVGRGLTDTADRYTVKAILGIPL